MLTYQIKQQIDATLNVIEQAGPVLDLLSSLSNYYDDCLLNLEGIATGGDKLNASASSIHSMLAGAQAALSGASTRKVFSALEHLTGALRSLSEIGDQESDYATRTTDRLDEFASALDNYLVSPTSRSAIPLLAKGQVANRSLDGLVGSIRLIGSALERTPPIMEHAETFSILLPNEDNLHGLILRLKAIQSLYLELCRLLSVSEVDYPLLVGKIETGSLWVRLFGESRVVGLIVDFLRSSAEFIYRNYTREGKIVSLPRKVDSLDQILQLRAKLHEQGIDSPDLDQELSRSAVLIAKSLSTVLEREASVSINGKTISVGDAVQQERLSAEQWPLLEAPNEDADKPKIGKSDDDGGSGTW